MIHLPPQKLNGLGVRSTNKSDPILSSLNIIADIHEAIRDDLSQICKITNIYLDLTSDIIQFRSRLEILNNVTYNEFRNEISDLSDAIRLNIIDRRYLPDLDTLKRIAPYDSNIIKINHLLLDLDGDPITRRI